MSISAMDNINQGDQEPSGLECSAELNTEPKFTQPQHIVRFGKENNDQLPFTYRSTELSLCPEAIKRPDPIQLKLTIAK